MKAVYHSIRKLLPQLPSGAERFLIFYMVVTSALSLLDIAALGILAAVLAPMITHTSTRLPFFGTIDTSDYVLVLIVVCALMIVKAVFALIIQFFSTRRLASYEMVVGNTLFNAYIRAPWIDRLSRSTAELVRMADVGIANVFGGVLIPIISLPQQLVTFFAVFVVLVAAQPLTASIALGYFGVIGAFMYFGISRAAVTAGQVNLRYSLRVTRLMTEMMAALKEVTLRNKFDEVAAVVEQNRRRSTRARANLQFLGSVPQRIIEAALVGGFVLVAAVGYAHGGATEAFSSVALFGVAGFRIIPSIVSFQSIMTSTANGLPHLDAVLNDINSAKNYAIKAEHLGKTALPDNPHELRVCDVSFTYPDSQIPAVSHVNLTVPFGSFLGIVGASGSGKSTLVDLLLGLLVADSGAIMVDDKNLEQVLGSWRMRVGYVPQDVTLFDATIAQNIALTWGEDIDEDRVRLAAKRAQLSDVIGQRVEGIHANIGERGIALSGGERQRLGIARALYVDPLVLVMDEATSALDTATEKAVTQAIRGLHGDITVISVAHRLSTIRHADQICHMDGGKITTHGTFNEVVARDPQFALQARLAGLV